MENFLATTMYSLSWFNKRNQDDELQIKPAFQRNPVWSEKQKSFLIDSMLRGFPVPELYMQEYTDPHGNDVYVVVDGQQRLRACFDFLAGKFSLHEQDSPDYAGYYFEDLSNDDKKKLFGYTFIIRKLPEMSHEELRKIFQRLNRNVVALNKQELRHATFWGEFISSAEKISNDKRWSSFGIFTPNDFRRMLDVEYVSELMIGYLHGEQNKKGSLDKWYAAYEDEFDERDEVESRFSSVIGEIDSILPNIDETRWSKKSDFYTLFLCLAEPSHKLPLARDDREKLREKLQIFADLVDQNLRHEQILYGFENQISEDVVKQYSEAVQRAASDLGNRRDRRDALNIVLGPYLQHV